MTSPQMADEIQFCEATHTYTVNGRVLPGITQVLKSVGIIDDSRYAPGSAERGTAIHMACQLDDEGDLDEATLDPAIRPYLEAWRQYRKDDPFIIEAVEKRIADLPLGFAGTIDRIVLRGEPPGLRGILDIKSGAPERWHGLQLAAYQMLAGTAGKRTAVHVKADGSYTVRYYGLLGEDRNVFLAALAIFHWKANNGK